MTTLGRLAATDAIVIVISIFALIPTAVEPPSNLKRFAPIVIWGVR